MELFINILAAVLGLIVGFILGRATKNPGDMDGDGLAYTRKDLGKFVGKMNKEQAKRRKADGNNAD